MTRGKRVDLEFQNVLEMNDCACDLQTYVIVNKSTNYIIMNVVLAESACNKDHQHT